MTPIALSAILKLGMFALETASMWTDGELTEDQVKARLDLMRAKIDDANSAWEMAGEEE